jgi:tetratricopeptide (TPR) repeat protein
MRAAQDARSREALDLYQIGAVAAAQGICGEILGADPAHFQALYLASVIAARSGDPAGAAGLLERALAVRPEHAEAHFNLGIVRRRLADRDGALASYDRALALDPRFAAAHFNRANLLQELGKDAMALAAYDLAIACKPDLAEAHANRGALLQRLHRVEAALASVDRALALREDYPEAHCNRGLLLREIGRWEASLQSCDRAIALNPDYAEAHVNKSLILLVAGALRPGWREYEWRLIAPAGQAEASATRFAAARWRGESLAGKTLLLHAEQGLGDTLQFCRYAPALAERGARVILEVQKPLLRTLAGLAGVTRLVACGEPTPPYDYHCPLLSLPLAFDTTLETVPRLLGYLRAEPERTAAWRERIAERTAAAAGPHRSRTAARVGLMWSGNPGNRRDALRSIALAELLRHLPPELEYVSIQREVRARDAAALAASALLDFSGEQTDFADAAALCECVDLVISVDTSIAHLAGALGKPTWVLLPFSPDWRWLLGRNDSPWYPSMTLYRQDRYDDWSGPLARIASDLARRFGSARIVRRPEPQREPREEPERASFETAFEAGLSAAHGRDPGRAAELFALAAESRPDHAAAHANLGLALAELGRWPEALASYDRALVLKPDHAVAWSNRGNALERLGRAPAALASFDRALDLRPDLAEAHLNRGSLLRGLNRWDEALASFERAVAQKPGLAEAWSGRGLVQTQRRQFDAALESFERALALAPGMVEAHVNRGVLFGEMGRPDEAIAAFTSATLQDTESAAAHFNLALALLARGEFARGWREYEWRFRTRDGGGASATDRFGTPRWQGVEPLAGRTMLLHAEQGLGDTLQFCRYALPVAQRGARVILEVQSPLAVLLDGLAGVAEVVVQGQPLPAFDVHCPLLSLPLAFDTTLETIPRQTPYLRADAERVALWRTRLEARNAVRRALRPLRVGLMWSGNADNRRDAVRSIALAEMLHGLPPQCEYVSLQRDVRPADAAVLAASPVLDLAADNKDFADAAALCVCMDLVISVDASIAHLAGALGLQTWVLLPFSPDWRWLRGRSDSPWYPSVTLYRQSRCDDWSDVLARVSADLADRAALASLDPCQAGARQVVG